MTTNDVELCVAILEDYFGYYVSTVGNVLLCNQLPLLLIIRKLVPNMGSREIKRSMVILDHHNLLDFTQSARGILYTVHCNHVICLLRIPRAILVAKTMFGNLGESIFEEIACRGKLSCSECCRTLIGRLDVDAKEVKKVFDYLVQANLIIRCKALKCEDDGFPILEECPLAHKPVPKILDAEEETTTTTKMEENSRKRKLYTNNNNTQKEDSDAKVLWRIHWPRMDRFIRDEFVVDSISLNEFFDSSYITVARLLLKVGEMKSEIYAAQSSPITLHDVLRCANETKCSVKREELSIKLEVISTESGGIIRRVGDSGGGLYVINYEKAIEQLSLNHIESTIREKLDDNAVRIFRLLCQKGFLEEEQIQKYAMLSSKEAKHFCYQLLDHNYITTRQIAKTNDFAPARTFYLYGVSLPSLLSTLTLFTSLSIRNMIRRRIQETKNYEILMDRQLKMETIIANIELDSNLDKESKKQQVLEVEEVYMTAGDKAELAKFRKGQRTLLSFEIEIEQVSFLLQQHLKFLKRASIEQMQQRKTRRKPRSIMDDFR